MNPFHKARELIMEHADLFSNLNELKQYARELIKRWEVDGIVDANEEDYMEVDDWVESKDFLLWLAQDHESMPEWLNKACVFELLRR